MPIYRIPNAAPAPATAAAAAGGVGVGVGGASARDGTIAQHVEQSTSGQQQRQISFQQRQVLQLHAAIIRL